MRPSRLLKGDRARLGIERLHKKGDTVQATRGLLRIFAISAALSLGACAETIPLQFPVGAPLRVDVHETLRHYTLAPDSKEYRQLELWIQQNRSGWSRYYISAPICGICVTGGEVQLNFLVVAFVNSGGWQKPVTPSEYAFLRR